MAAQNSSQSFSQLVCSSLELWFQELGRPFEGTSSAEKPRMRSKYDASHRLTILGLKSAETEIVSTVEQSSVK